MKLSDFDFELPNELIAQNPCPERGESRLLVVNRSTASIEHATFNDLPRYLKDHPVIVFNDTRVLPAKLEGTVGELGKNIEVLLVKEEEPGTWQVLMKDLKKWKPGQRFIFGKGNLEAEFVERKEDTAVIRFAQSHDLESNWKNSVKCPCRTTFTDLLTTTRKPNNRIVNGIKLCLPATRARLPHPLPDCILHRNYWINWRIARNLLI